MVLFHFIICTLSLLKCVALGCVKTGAAARHHSAPCCLSAVRDDLQCKDQPATLITLMLMGSAAVRLSLVLQVGGPARAKRNDADPQSDDEPSRGVSQCRSHPPASECGRWPPWPIKFVGHQNPLGGRLHSSSPPVTILYYTLKKAHHKKNKHLTPAKLFPFCD